ncbi:MAG: hypothetical protein J6M55_03140 [Paludibacteraceae bacterium]|nr:hypothetical protein [Paludibacteraceae bacterium]
MRKLFSILVVALFALSAHATVVTQSIPLSDFSGNATFDGSVITASDNSWPGIYKNDGYSAFALSESHYTELVVELTENPSAEVYVEVTYSDNTKNNISITTSETSGRLVLADNNVTSVAIKLKAAGSVTLSNVYFYKVIGKETVTVIKNPEGGHAFNNWLSSLSCDQLEDYSALHEGDFLRINYTATASSDWAQCQVKIATTNASLSRTKQDYVYNEENASEDGVVNLVLSSEDVAALQANGCYLNGKNMTINSVSLVTYAQQFMEEYVLNVGNEAIDWSAHWEHTAGLPTLAAGDELRVTVSTVSGQYPQVNFRHNDNGTNPLTIEGINGTVPKVYSVTLDATQAANINSGKLFIVGQDVTLSRFAVAKPRSIYTALYHGEKAMDWDGLFFEASNFSGLTVGDRLCANVSAIGDLGDYPQLYFDADYTSFSPEAHYNFSANNAAPMAVSYPVTSEMISLLKTNGLRVKGQYCTITEVYVQDAEPTTVSYKLPVTSAEMATLVLPFDVPNLPDGVQAYNLTNNGDATIWAEEVTSLQADKPVLIVADENAEGYEFVSEEGASDDISGKAGTYRNGALVGTFRLIEPLYGDDGEDGPYHYILQNGAEGVGFYRVRNDPCFVEPYRAYLSCGYNAPTSVDAPARAMRIVFRENTTTGVENTESTKMDGSAKFLRNGQLFILRNGVEYNANGALVK